jgi:hypothetical protein
MSEVNYLIFSLKYTFRVIHIFSFAMLFGDVSYNLFLTPRLNKGTYSSLSVTFWVLIIISGLVNMILFIIEKKFVRDFYYEVWKKSLIVKFIITIFLTPALEGLISLGIKNDDEKVSQIAVPIRFTIMLILFLGSSFLRYFREYYMKSESENYIK